MFHVYGLSLLTTGLLSLGSTIVVMRRFDAEEASRAIERYRVTHFPLVPPMLVALSKVRRSGHNDFGSLKHVSSRAAPLSEEKIPEFTRSFPLVDFIQVRKKIYKAIIIGHWLIEEEVNLHVHLPHP